VTIGGAELHDVSSVQVRQRGALVMEYSGPTPEARLRALEAPVSRDERGCEAGLGAGLDPSTHARCGRRVTHIAIDDDGETYRLCRRCAAVFEGGLEVRPLRTEDQEDR
jgi:hypothetical protein